MFSIFGETKTRANENNKTKNDFDGYIGRNSINISAMSLFG